MEDIYLSNKFLAFLSYSHVDHRIANRLHADLERYRPAEDLVGRQTRFGRIPERPRQIFRDRDNLAASHSLSAEISEALANSAFLIVVCSRTSARSIHVNSEVARFKALGRSERILAIIIDGEPNSPQNECFPEALRFKVDADGKVTQERDVDPIAADAREIGDGAELARLKTIAGMLGVGLDEIVRRSLVEQRRRRRIWATIASAMGVLALCAVGAAVWALSLSRKHEQLLGATMGRASQLVQTSVRSAKESGVPVQDSIAFLDQAALMFDDIKAFSASSSELHERTAELLAGFADGYESLGRHSVQLGYAERALRELQSVVGGVEPSPRIRTAIAAAHWRIGRAHGGLGNQRKALEFYEHCQKQLEGQAPSIPDDILQHKIMAAKCKAEAAMKKQLLGRSDEAIAALKEVTVFLSATVAEFPDDAPAQQLAALTHMELAETLRQRHDAEGALAESARGLEIVSRIRPGFNRMSIVRLTGSMHVIRGDSFTVLRRYGPAVEEYRQSLAAVGELARRDPTSVSLRAEIGFFHLKIGEALHGLGKIEEALEEFDTSIRTVENDAVANPTSAPVQNVLSYALQDKAATLLRMQKLDAALETFQRRLGTAERLRQADGQSQLALRSIAEASAGIGDVHMRLGRTVEAYPFLIRSLDIRRTLASGAPNNQLAQRTFAAALTRAAEAELLLQGPERAMALFKEALEIQLADVALGGVARPIRRRDVALTYRSIGEITLKLRDCGASVKAYDNAIDHLQKALSEQPSAVEWNGDLDTWRKRRTEILAECAAGEQPRGRQP